MLFFCLKRSSVLNFRILNVCSHSLLNCVLTSVARKRLAYISLTRKKTNSYGLIALSTFFWD